MDPNLYFHLKMKLKSFYSFVMEPIIQGKPSGTLSSSEVCCITGWLFIAFYKPDKIDNEGEYFVQDGQPRKYFYIPGNQSILYKPDS